MDSDEKFDCLEKRVRTLETHTAVHEERQEHIDKTLTTLSTYVNLHTRFIYIGFGIVIALQAIGIVLLKKVFA